MSKTKALKARARPRLRAPHVMVSVLSQHERTGWIHPRLTAEIACMALGSGARYQMTYVPMHGEVFPVSAARNRIVTRHFLPSSADWLCMFDNDIGPPENVIDVILNAPAEADIAILPYWIWCAERRPALCFGDLKRFNGKPHMYPRPYKSLGWHEGGAGGTGAIFIRRRVFEKIKKPYFKLTYDTSEELTLGEDIYFTFKARKAGCRVFTNLDYMCAHYRTLDLGEVNAGVNSILQRYVKAAQEKFGAHGVELPDLNTMLAMAKKV